jgi:precorrin-8X/cobalt-precorrin-8 methylmutase
MPQSSSPGWASGAEEEIAVTCAGTSARCVPSPKSSPRDRDELSAWFAGGPNLTDAQRRIREPRRLGRWSHGARPQSGLRPAPARCRRSVNTLAVGVPSWDRRHLRHDSAESLPATTYEIGRIYRRSFIGPAEADLAGFAAATAGVRLAMPPAMSRSSTTSPGRGVQPSRPARLAAGDADARDKLWHRHRDRLPAGTAIICTLGDPETSALAARLATTRSAAAVELWRPDLAGAVVAIGNAPTALFHLLEMLAAGGARPAVILGFPVGFVGAAEAKEALIGFGGGLAYVTLRGRRGGSALLLPRSMRWPRAAAELRMPAWLAPWALAFSASLPGGGAPGMTPLSAGRRRRLRRWCAGAAAARKAPPLTDTVRDLRSDAARVAVPASAIRCGTGSKPCVRHF